MIRIIPTKRDGVVTITVYEDDKEIPVAKKRVTRDEAIRLAYQILEQALN